MFGLSILSTDILEYKLTDGIITNAVGMSTVVLHLNLRSSLNASVVTRFANVFLWLYFTVSSHEKFKFMSVIYLLSTMIMSAS